MFIRQVLCFEENGKPFLWPKANLESKQRVGIGKKRVGLIDWVAGEVALHIRTGVKAGSGQIKQFCFIEILRNSSDAVVPIDRIIIEMKIVQRVGLT